MKWVLITGEGRTEERFVKNILAPHFFPSLCTDVRIVTTVRDRTKGKHGGVSKYKIIKDDIRCWMKERNDRDIRFTSMIDFYALPKDFPGYAEAQQIRDIYEKVEFLESKFAEDINHSDGWDDYRFIPYIQLHEFEALVFCGLDALEFDYPNSQEQITDLKTILAEYTNEPERINDNVQTAPSKRILAQIPEYDKVLSGSTTTSFAGMELLQEMCPHFAQWIAKLKEFGETNP